MVYKFDKNLKKRNAIKYYINLTSLNVE